MKINIIFLFAITFLIFLTIICSAQNTIGDQSTILEHKEKAALVLNTAEYLYGNIHCKKIIQYLENNGYNVTYLADDAINLNYTKHNLKADIIYINTHAGYLDTDGDNISDSVVIGTGERWVNETPQKHSFEYEHNMIVKGEAAGEDWVAFTPSFIEYYYHVDDLQGSLVYMATCYATYDDSMANAFLNASADVYIGWTKNTVFWTNSIVSVISFKLLSMGFDAKQICKLIRHGGLYNLIFGSKLTYYGDGNHTITTRKGISLNVS